MNTLLASLFQVFFSSLCIAPALAWVLGMQVSVHSFVHVLGIHPSSHPCDHSKWSLQTVKFYSKFHFTDHWAKQGWQVLLFWCFFSHFTTVNRRPRWLSWMRVCLETRRSRVQPPPRLGSFFRGDWSWNIFYGHSLPSADSKRAVVSFWRKNVHNTVNRLED